MDSVYTCPKCKHYSMAWDGRAKVLMCYWSSCMHVIRIPFQKKIPTEATIKAALDGALDLNLLYGDMYDTIKLLKSENNALRMEVAKLHNEIVRLKS